MVDFRFPGKVVKEGISIGIEVPPYSFGRPFYSAISSNHHHHHHHHHSFIISQNSFSLNDNPIRTSLCHLHPRLILIQFTPASTTTTIPNRSSNIRPYIIIIINNPNLLLISHSHGRSRPRQLNGDSLSRVTPVG